MLTEEQQRFLFRYTNNKGDFYKTVDSLGLDLSHISSWQESSKEFALAFKQAKQIVIEHLKQENYMMSLAKINDALINGITQNTVQQKHRVIGQDDEGREISEFEIIRTTKHVGVPAWAINESLRESSIVRAVNTLASEGVIPTAIARKILQKANQITDDIKESFGLENDTEFLSEKKAIALIKSAILGNGVDDA